jgi:hypothetical protein
MLQENYLWQVIVTNKQDYDILMSCTPENTTSNLLLSTTATAEVRRRKDNEPLQFVHSPKRLIGCTI